MRKYGVGLAATVALSLVLSSWSATARAQQGGDGSRRVIQLLSTYQPVQNIVYRVASGAEQKLDLYQPAGLQSPNPVLMFFHGGGWTTATKESVILSLLPWIDMG